MIVLGSALSVLVTGVDEGCNKDDVLRRTFLTLISCGGMEIIVAGWAVCVVVVVVIEGCNKDEVLRRTLLSSVGDEGCNKVEPLREWEWGTTCKLVGRRTVTICGALKATANCAWLVFVASGGDGCRRVEYLFLGSVCGFGVVDLRVLRSMVVLVVGPGTSSVSLIVSSIWPRNESILSRLTGPRSSDKSRLRLGFQLCLRASER